MSVQVNPSAVATIGEINDLQQQIDAMKDVDKGLSNRIEVLEKSNLVPYQRFTNVEDARKWSEKYHGIAEVVDS